jgi:hypothetical protein
MSSLFFILVAKTGLTISPGAMILPELLAERQ